MTTGGPTSHDTNAHTREVKNEIEWIKLTEGKEHSRLLYTNPVCFLTVPMIVDNDDDNINKDGKDDDNEDDTNMVADNCEISNDKNNLSSSKTQTTTDDQQRRMGGGNVMILSWLSPLNNDGSFMFSINKRRNTTSYFINKQINEFVLSVPIKGMEQLVLNVGSCSGRFGSKFPNEYSSSSEKMDTDDAATKIANMDVEKGTIRMSNRKRKKLKRFAFEKGVPGLYAVSFGDGFQRKIASEDRIGRQEYQHFAIDGTVAQMKCSIISILADDIISSPSSSFSPPPSNDGCVNKVPMEDDDHYIIIAKIDEAYVHPSYWDGQKKQFRPMLKQNTNKQSDDCNGKKETENSSQPPPPYLTFFGSQTFGYVVGENTLG